MRSENDVLKAERPGIKADGEKTTCGCRQINSATLHTSSNIPKKCVMLNIDYEDAGGKPLDLETVLYDLSRRNISELYADDLGYRIKRHEEHILIADVQEESDADSDAVVFTARDEMSAGMLLLPPCGQGRNLSAREIKEILGSTMGNRLWYKRTSTQRSCFRPDVLSDNTHCTGAAPRKRRGR